MLLGRTRLSSPVHVLAVLLEDMLVLEGGAVAPSVRWVDLPVPVRVVVQHVFLDHIRRRQDKLIVTSAQVATTSQVVALRRV